jgi:hypothetical protein
MDEMRKWTKDYYRTQERVNITQLLFGNEKGWTWPDMWVPYFGGDPVKEVVGNPNWKNNVVKEPYTLHFISTGKWITYQKFGTRWMASFDPGGNVPTEVDIRTAVQYAEDRHKDDVATMKKKWKYL